MIHQGDILPSILFGSMFDLQLMKFLLIEYFIKKLHMFFELMKSEYWRQNWHFNFTTFFIATFKDFILAPSFCSVLILLPHSKHLLSKHDQISKVLLLENGLCFSK